MRPADGAAQEPPDQCAFWLEHCLAIVVLLDRAAGTPFAAYPASFVERLVGHAQQHLPAPAGPEQEAVLELAFDNTRGRPDTVSCGGRRAHTSPR